MGGAWERLIGIIRRIIDSSLLETKRTRTAHKVLCTFMAEARAIVNARPLVSLSTDPENLCVLSTAALLTQKTEETTQDSKNLCVGNVYASQWKNVQSLAEMFWDRLKTGYLQNLQTRRKWKQMQETVKVGDIVLLRDSDNHQNNWPIGKVERVQVFHSNYRLVCKLDVHVARMARFTNPFRKYNFCVILIS